MLKLLIKLINKNLYTFLKKLWKKTKQQTRSMYNNYICFEHSSICLIHYQHTLLHFY